MPKIRNWQTLCAASSDEGRFWSKVDLSDGECWVWTGARRGDGYGLFFIGGRSQGAHRVVWQFLNGDIPVGQHVLHRCDNPPCVRPDHLFLGTNYENIRDCQRKGRKTRGERTGTAKLNERIVQEIRDRYTGAWGEQSRLALEYQVSSRTISSIVRRTGWSHVT